MYQSRLCEYLSRKFLPPFWEAIRKIFGREKFATIAQPDNWLYLAVGQVERSDTQPAASALGQINFQKGQ